MHFDLHCINILVSQDTQGQVHLLCFSTLMAFGFQPPVFYTEMSFGDALNCNIDNMGTYLVFSNKKEEAKER